MKGYKNIKDKKLTAGDIAKLFGYKSANAFRNSTAYHRILKGVDKLIDTLS